MARALTVVRNSLPETIFEDLRGFSGFGQIPGITPDGITDIEAVIARSYKDLKNLGGRDAVSAVKKLVEKPTNDMLDRAIAAVQGLLNMSLQAFERERAERGFVLSFTARKFYSDTWDSAATELRTFYNTLGGPAHKLKLYLRSLPEDRPASVETIHETTRQLLGYYLAYYRAIWIMGSVRDDVPEMDLSALQKLRMILHETGVLAGEVIKFTLDLAGEATAAIVPPILGAIPWYVWVGGGLFLYVLISRSPVATGARTAYRRLKGQEA